MGGVDVVDDGGCQALESRLSLVPKVNERLGNVSFDQIEFRHRNAEEADFKANPTKQKQMAAGMMKRPALFNVVYRSSLFGNCKYHCLTRALNNAPYLLCY